MGNHQIVLEFIYFLIAAVTFVPLFKKIGLGPILGYLFAGIVIGPWALGLINETNSITEFAEIGIILLFFVIGLEISPRRLIALKNKIFVYGTFQVLLTTTILTIFLYLCKIPFQASFVIGFALAISSTAYALNVLKRRNEITYSYGQASVGILLFQDLIVIPVLALIPLLSPYSDGNIVFTWVDLFKSVSIFVTIVVFSFYLFKPFMRYISKTQHNEIFIAACLLIVLGTAIMMKEIGLSMGLGAFMAGVFLANSEVKLEIEKSILPFKSLLMGLFFMRIGLDLNFSVFNDSWGKILVFTSLLIAAKFAVLFLVAKWQGIEARKCVKLGILLCEAGEFSFVILAEAYHEKILPDNTYEFLLATAIISMFAASILYNFANFLDKKKPIVQEESLAQEEAVVVSIVTSQDSLESSLEDLSEDSSESSSEDSSEQHDQAA